MFGAIAYSQVPYASLPPARPLWELINDTQSTTWGVINVNQPLSWSVISTSENGNWNVIPTEN